MCPAGYEDIDASRIPVAEIEGGRVKVIARDFVDTAVPRSLRVSGPVAGVSTQPIFFDVTLQSDAEFRYRLPERHSAYLYVFEGGLAARAEGSLPTGLSRRQGGVLGPGAELRLAAGAEGVRFLLLAAAPNGEPVVHYRPFVMTTQAEIERAIADYQLGRLTAKRRAAPGRELKFRAETVRRGRAASRSRCSR